MILGSLKIQVAYEKGDVNMDGLISSDDATAVLNHYNNTELLTSDVEKYFADVDNNGYINQTDYNLINQIISGN